MQNAGQQYGQGGASSHPGAPYGHTDSSNNNSGSITSSLRQFRKKDVEKHQVNDTSTSVSESHVARVAPHNHYPPRPTECYRYPPQYQDYSLPSQVKYSEISDPQPLQEQLSPTVIQKAKGKEYMDMCNVQQNHMKQPFPDHLNGQQPYPSENNLHAHAQYLQKDPQVHPPYKPESQYYPKEPQYQQLPHQIQKYTMPAQIRKYPTENDFLSKLRRIHPSMARSIMSDHHLQESQPSYQAMDQNRMYPHQNQRYMNYPPSMQGNPYPPSYMPPQHYPNFPSSCSYTRPPQMGPRFPSINNHERSLSPRRGYTENMPIPPINYTALPQKISPNYSQYNSPEYAQHYQHRRPPMPPQEFYQQHCRTPQYLPHQMPSQEMSENRVTVSDSIKQYIENWADEETASEMNQLETNRLCKENLRVRDDQSTETVYMINASELQYLENGIPLVTSENGIPLVASENGQYILKSGVAIDNSTGMVRIVDKSNHLEPSDNNVDRVVNLHIMDPMKPDCMLASKPQELNQKQNDNSYSTDEKPKVVIHQNTVIQPGQQNMPKEPCDAESETLQHNSKPSNNLPLITESETTLLDKLDESIFKVCKKETVDKNCSPINVEQMEKLEEFQEDDCHAPMICPTRLQNEAEGVNTEEENSNDVKLKNMPIIDMLAEEINNTIEHHDFDVETLASDAAAESGRVKEHSSSNRELTSKCNGEDSATNSNEAFESSAGMANEEEANLEAPENSPVTNITKAEICEIEKDIKKEVEEEIDDRSKMVDEVPQMIKDSVKEIKKEELLEAKVQVAEIDNMTTSEMIEQKLDKAEKTVTKELPTLFQSENKETPISKEGVTTGDDKEKVSDATQSCSENSNVEEKVSTSTLEKISKPSTKRSKRIFSVDDIMNNIGNNTNKYRVDKERAERRRSLQLTREFLEKEIDHSYTFLQKLEAKETVIKEFQALNEKEENENISEKSQKIDVSDEQIVEPVSANVAEEVTCKRNTKIEESKDEKSTEKDANAINRNGNGDIAEDKIRFERQQGADCKDVPSEITNEEKLISSKAFSEDASYPEVVSNIVEESTLSNPEADLEPVLDLKQTEAEAGAQNEVHYRNAIRVEENSVLLQIAGELVEINVTSVNGKKVITVVPLSESTIVDFNDNYDMLENIEVNDPIETVGVEADDAVETTELEPIEEVVPQPDIIESTSEIIIGMDISLEAEVQLDLEKPQPLCTKAAKKAYENDLQIPSITTSEDINDNNKTDNYSGNDKVSSSKEQSSKDKSEKKNSVKIDSSRKKEDIVKRPKCATDKELDPDKRALRELMRVRKLKKEKLQQKSVEEEEEFVPFKDLVKARKLKKLKLQQSMGSENVGADSTNKVDQEDTGELANKSKEKKSGPKEKIEEEVRKVESAKNKDEALKSKEHKPKVSKKSPKTETERDEVTDKRKDDKDEVKVDKKPHSKTKEDINSSTAEKVKEKVKEKGARKVTFGPVNYYDREKAEELRTEIRNLALQDPRVKAKVSGDVIVPSVSEILKENERLENSKKRLSLEEYNKRKRKLSVNSNEDERATKMKKITLETSVAAETKLAPTEETNGQNKPKEIRSAQEKADRVKMPRPKSLDDFKVVVKQREAIQTKRKFSLEVTSYKPNYFDWEETQSPKTNLHCQENSDKHLCEFSGLINNNKSKIVIDINDLNARPLPSDNSEDEILQNYKEQVDSKLSSLNIQIPRVAKLPNATMFNPFSKPETNNLMQRFLKNEKITFGEMDKIKQIISYKRLMQQLKNIESPDLASPSLKPSYEIRKSCAEKEMKLHLKKVPGKKSKRRFRNLYSESTSESDSDFSDTKKIDGDYSVIQSNCFAAGVPKLIIKRKTEMPVPVVRLERLDLGLLVNKKRKIY